jgi:hypothetical protein
MKGAVPKWKLWEGGVTEAFALLWCSWTCVSCARESCAATDEAEDFETWFGILNGKIWGGYLGLKAPE